MNNSQKSLNIDSYLESIIQESLSKLKSKKIVNEQASDEQKKLKSGEVSSKDIVEKLNTIRSGKSFKEEAIANSLESYINDMTKAEKTALFAFLKGISQIVTAEFSAEKAIDPSKTPANVKMKKTGTSKVTIKPVVVKKPLGGEEKKKPPAEDTTGPVPIKPKK